MHTHHSTVRTDYGIGHTLVEVILGICIDSESHFFWLAHFYKPKSCRLQLEFYGSTQVVGCRCYS